MQRKKPHKDPVSCNVDCPSLSRAVMNHYPAVLCRGTDHLRTTNVPLYLGMKGSLEMFRVAIVARKANDILIS
jgi:hypothetical protein